MATPATPTLSVSLSLTTTYQKLSTLLSTAYPTILNDGTIENIGFFNNLSGTISCYVAAGYTSAPSGNVGLLSPLQTVDFVEGMNANDVWIKSASGTPTMDFWIGATAGPAPSVTGVIGTITATTNTITKASSGNLVNSTITDDGTTIAMGELVTFAAKVSPATDDGAALGDTTHNFSDLFLATGAVLNYNNGNVAVTHSSGILTMGTGELRITTPGTNAASVPTLGSTSTLTAKTLTAPVLNAGTVGTSLVPTTDDGAALGDTTHNFSDLFLASGAVLNYANGNVVVTHTSGILTMGTGDFRVSTAGTNTASVVTVGGTQTLAAKTLTTPVIGVATGTSLAVSGLLTSSSPTAGIGYATGAGGAVTQSTDKSTTVASNTITTAITLNNAALAASTTVGFTFTNTTISGTDTVLCTHQSAGTSAAYNCNAFPGSGSAVISVRNVTLGSLSEAIVLRVTVIKSVSA